MKKIIFTLAHLLIFTSLIAQQNAIWSLPPNYVDFNGGNPTIQPLPTQPIGSINPGTSYPNYYGDAALYSHNAMQDQNGDLLFFIVDDGIYDKNGLGVGMLTGFVGAVSQNEVVIIPDPANCERFYIAFDDVVYAPDQPVPPIYF